MELVSENNFFFPFCNNSMHEFMTLVMVNVFSEKKQKKKGSWSSIMYNITLLVLPQSGNKYSWDLQIYDRINRNKKKYHTQHNIKKKKAEYSYSNLVKCRASG